MEEEEAGNHKTRDFICACGKNYLSYAALFTHIKQKHDGKVMFKLILGAWTYCEAKVRKKEGPP
jgi:hypothetical protein